MSLPPTLVNNRSRFATFNLKWRHSQFESQNKNWSPANSEHTFWLLSDLFWFMCVWGKMDWAQLAFWQVTMTRASCLNQFQIFMQKEGRYPSKDWSARLPNAKSPDLSKEFIKWFKTLWHTHKLNFTFCLKSSMNIQNAKNEHLMRRLIKIDWNRSKLNWYTNFSPLASVLVKHNMPSSWRLQLYQCHKLIGGITLAKQLIIDSNQTKLIWNKLIKMLWANTK